MKNGVELAKIVRALVCKELGGISEQSFKNMKQFGGAAKARQVAAMILNDSGVSIQDASTGLEISNKGTLYSLIRAANKACRRNQGFKELANKVAIQAEAEKNKLFAVADAAKATPLKSQATTAEKDPPQTMNAEEADLVIFSLSQNLTPETLAKRVNMPLEKVLISIGRVASKFGGNTASMQKALEDGGNLLNRILFGF